MKSTNRKRVSLRIEAFEMSIKRIGYKICDLAAGRTCELSKDGCGRHRQIRGIDLCDTKFNKRVN